MAAAECSPGHVLLAMMRAHQDSVAVKTEDPEKSAENADASENLKAEPASKKRGRTQRTAETTADESPAQPNKKKAMATQGRPGQKESPEAQPTESATKGKPAAKRPATKQKEKVAAPAKAPSPPAPPSSAPAKAPSPPTPEAPSAPANAPSPPTPEAKDVAKMNKALQAANSKVEIPPFQRSKSS